MKLSPLCLEVTMLREITWNFLTFEDWGLSDIRIDPSSLSMWISLDKKTFYHGHIWTWYPNGLRPSIRGLNRGYVTDCQFLSDRRSLSHQIEVGRYINGNWSLHKRTSIKWLWIYCNSKNAALNEAINLAINFPRWYWNEFGRILIQGRRIQDDD